MDKQARLALAEHVVYCRRSDKLSIPFIGFFHEYNFRRSFFFTKGSLWYC